LRAFGFAVLTPLGLVFKALVDEKHLFAGGENKFLTAFRTLQNLIVVFHTLLRGPRWLQSPQHFRTGQTEPDSRGTKFESQTDRYEFAKKTRGNCLAWLL